MTRRRLATSLIAFSLVALLLPAAVAATVPDAVDDSHSMAEDSGPDVIDVLGNDDTDAGALVIDSVSLASHGQASLDGQDVTYDPDPNYFGSDSFTYDVHNDDGVSTATVNITVTSVNDDPVANPDTFTINEDTTTDFNVLSNDTDVEGQPLSIQSTSGASHGSTTVVNGKVRYGPDSNYHGDDTFTYMVSDGHGGTDVGTVDVTINSINDDPVANTDTFTIDEDVTTEFDVLANDTDIDGGTPSIFGNPAGADHGTTTVVAGKIRYDPALNYNGTDSFTYTIRDGQGGSDVGTVNVTIDPVNDKPVADNDSTTVLEDSTNNVISVLVGDSDPDGDSLTVISTTTPAKGLAAVHNGGADVTYTPGANQTGSDGFDYTVSDGNGGTDDGHVTITVTAVDDAPNAVNDTATVDEDDPPTSIDVLTNDTDIDTSHASLDVSAVTQGAHGDVSITSTGVAYQPDPNYHGPDSFTYTVSDGAKTDVGTVTVTVNSVNDVPIAGSDTDTTAEDTTVDVDVLANDTDVDVGDTLSISSPTGAVHGTTTVVSGKVRYVPALNFDGTDTFTYTVSDGHGGTADGTVTVTITPVNDDPVAVHDDFRVDEDLPHPQQLNVLATDSDVDGDALTITAAGPATKGTVTISTDETAGKFLLYKPFTNKSGDDTFPYTISDGHGGQATGTVTVTIGGENDPPNAVNDLVSVPEGAGPTVVDVLANDSDPDGDLFTILSKTNGAHGTVSITGNGTGLKYNPAGNYVGTDTFRYTLDDGHGDTDQATVKVTVLRDKTAPVSTAPLERFIGQTVGTTTTKVRLAWGATDAGSGVKSYKLQVSTNGGSYKTITLSKPTSKSIDRALKSGNRYRFRVRATDKEGNVGAYAYGPTFKVTRWSQESSTVFYVQSWTMSHTSKVLGGTARHASSTTRSATFVFTGRDVGWIATRATTSGKAHISIDGAAPTTIDLDTSSTAYRKLVFQRHFATSGPHTLKIQPLGDGRVDIDGFALLD